MAGELRPRGYLASEQYPGYHLSIIEALNAVSTKLSQVDDVSGSFTLPMIQSFEQALSQALVMVRRHLNSHSPVIRRIPSEILIMIASHLKVDAAFIIKATHVCHHWRATLLSCPGLWAYLDFSRESHALSFLDRSKSFPIHVDLKNTILSPSTIEILCQHAARVDTLKINHYHGLHRLFLLPLASLKTLSVAREDNWGFNRGPHIEAREFPALTSLTVKHNPSALAFRSTLITHLHISTSTSYEEVTSFPDLLRSCVFLERLDIENRGDLEGSLRLYPADVIPLPHLRILTQTLHHDRLTAGVINILDLPPSCSVVLRCIVGPTYSHPPFNLPILRNTSYFNNPKRLKVVHVRGRLGGEGNFTLGFINDRGARFTVITGFTNFTIDPPGVEHSKDDRIERSIPGIEVLCVDGRYVSMESFGSLKTLVLSGLTAHLYLESLAEPEGHIACKNLRRLVLFFDQNWPVPNLVRYLPNVAQTRARAGLPLRTITFVCPSALSSDDLKDLEGLRAYVEQVELLLGDKALDRSLDEYFLS